MKVVIIIPTYNEAENVQKLIPVLETEFAKHTSHEFHVLFVDGNSPDHTGEIIRTAGYKNANVHLLTEQKKAGLGAAYISGFSYVLKNMNADAIVEMDADFQHSPQDIIRLVTEIDNGYDYVIGSRFTKGGSIPGNWAFYRKVLSRGGNLFSKVVLNIYNLHDFTSGFKASRVKGFVDRIDFSALLSGGFAYKIDLLYKMHKLGAKFKEVPIVFGLRDRGDSKMEKSNFFDSLKVVLTIRFRESKSFFKFLTVGAIGLVVDTTSFNIFRLVLARSSLAALLSGLIGLLTTFILNNFWSFGERKLEGFSKNALSFVLYLLSSLVPIFVRSKLVYFAGSRFGDTFLISNTAFFVGIAFGLVWNYAIYSRIIWRKVSH